MRIRFQRPYCNWSHGGVLASLLPQEFISAGKPKEACDMYMHNQDWDAAMRIAERYDPTMVSDILVAQARVAAERKQWLPAEVRA